MKKTTSIILEEEELTKLQEIANQQDRSVSSVIRAIIRECLEKKK